MWGKVFLSSSRTRALAIVACGTIAAGAGLLLFRRRRQRSAHAAHAAHDTPAIRPRSGDDGIEEEGDRRKLEMAAREEAAQLHFDGVGGHMFSTIPFDENDENEENDEDDESSSSASSDDDGEFIDGEDDITAMLDRDAAKAKEGNNLDEKNYKTHVTGTAAEDPELRDQLDDGK